MSFTVTFKSLAFNRRFRAGRALDNALQAQLKASGEALAQRMRTYPPERVGQTYRRTYRLQAAVFVSGVQDISGNRVVTAGIREEDVPYIRPVMGTPQYWAHSGRWPKMENLARDYQSTFFGNLRKVFEAMVPRIIEG